MGVMINNDDVNHKSRNWHAEDKGATLINQILGNEFAFEKEYNAEFMEEELEEVKECISE